MRKKPENTLLRQHPRGKLSRLWKNLLVTTALATTIACTPNNKAETEPAPEDAKPTTTMQETAPPPQTVEEAFQGDVIIITEPMVISISDMAEVLEQERRDNIRIAMLQRAQRDFARLAALARTSYSTQIDSLEMALNNYIVAHDATVHSRAAILDPAQFDVGIALGMTPQQTVAQMLTLERVPVTRDRVMYTMGKIAIPYDTRLGVPGYTQDPAAISNFTGQEPDICIIVPTSDHALVTDIPGLSHADEIVFINRHEEWHCKDNIFNLRHMTQEELGKITPGLLADNVDNRPMLELFSTFYKKEALGDVGAVGDMVRKDGYSLDIIDSILTWRQDNPDDIQHLSSPVLRELKRRIMAMGRPAFRAMDDHAAEALYVDIVREKGMSARSLEVNIRFEKADAVGRRAWLEQAKTDPEVEKAIDFISYYRRTPVDNRPTGELSADERALAEQIMQWNPFMQLENRAFALSRKITPSSLVQAYGLLQDELRAEMLANPDNKLTIAKMTALQKTFSWQVQTTDYVEANELRGVDITKAERGLRQFALQTPHNPAPATR